MAHYVVPSKRTYPPLGLERHDDNIFFTCLCLRIIKDFKLEHPLAKKFDPAIFENFVEVIDGAKLYMFWKDQPNAYFPNGVIFHRHRKFRSPPDADDTSLIYYLIEHPDNDVGKYFQSLRNFANTSNKVIQNGKPEYLDKKIFSTWFGSGKMPIEFDLTVILNIFYTLEKYSYPMDQYYSDSIFFIKNEVASKSYLHRPFRSSLWYANPCQLYYHTARFLYFHEFHELNEIRSALINQLDEVTSFVKSTFDLLLIDSASIMLGLPAVSTKDLSSAKLEVSKFPSSTLSMLSLVPNKLSWALSRYRLFHLKFICETYNELLIEENKELRRLTSH